jgi:hypothetical protein
LSLSILPSQCRAARALIDMDQAELARRAVVPRHVVADFENGSLTPSANDLAARVVLADGPSQLRLGALLPLK